MHPRHFVRQVATVARRLTPFEAGVLVLLFLTALPLCVIVLRLPPAVGDYRKASGEARRRVVERVPSVDVPLRVDIHIKGVDDALPVEVDDVSTTVPGEIER